MRTTPGRTLLVAVLAVLCLPGTARAAQTIVSLQFDDGRGEEAAGPILEKHRMRATFFVNTGSVGTRDHLTWRQLRELAHDGHEIAGHTVGHRDLPSLSPAEQRREVCGDRNALIRHGFRPTNFAYPFGSHDAVSRQIVWECGYSSGRGAGGLWGSGCVQERASCPYAVDPARIPDLWAIPTAGAPTDRTSVEDLREVILKARSNGGGWVQILWHRLCPEDCGSHSWAPDALDAFLSWLEHEQAAGDVEVRTSQEVLAGVFRPAVSPPKPPAPPAGANRLRNPSLEQTDDRASAPACWERHGRGWTWAQGVHGRGQAVTISSAPRGSAALLVARDQGECSAAVEAGELLAVRAAYRSRGRPRIVMWARSAAGGWSLWRAGKRLAPTGRFRRASFRPPPVPAGVTALSVGVALSGVGRLAVDDLALTELHPASPGGQRRR